MQIKKILEEKIVAFFEPVFLSIENESHKHVSKQKNPTESHFKLTIVSDKFINVSRLERHRLIYKLINDLLTNEIHALALHTYTEDEWRTKQYTPPASPKCHGNNSSNT
jgi:BolA protein